MNDLPPTEQDQRLIAATLTGNREAFGELVGKYQNRLFNSLVNFMGNELDAQDVAQDAFILALTRLKSFRGHSSFFTWLYRIARNVAITRFRRAKKNVSIERGNDQMPMELTSQVPGPEVRLQRDEDVCQVKTALSRVSDEHREILVLREIDGMDYDAIADVLEVPVGTVRSRLHRARMQLKVELEKLLQTTKHV